MKLKEFIEELQEMAEKINNDDPEVLFKFYGRCTLDTESGDIMEDSLDRYIKVYLTKRIPEGEGY